MLRRIWCLLTGERPNSDESGEPELTAPEPERGKVFCVNCKHHLPDRNDRREDRCAVHTFVTQRGKVDYVSGVVTHDLKEFTWCSIHNNEGECRKYEAK